MKQVPTPKLLLYKALEIAPPTNRLSAFIRGLTFFLLFLNTVALISSFFDFFNPYRFYFYWGLEAFSIAFFVTEYILRVYSASEGKLKRSRVLFVLRPVMLIDLACIVPVFFIITAPTLFEMLRILRIAWVIRYLKLAREFRRRPVLEASRDALLADVVEKLEIIRQEVSAARAADLTRTQQHIDAERTRCHDLWFVQDRQLDIAPQIAPINQLEAQLTDETQIQNIKALIQSAYQQSSAVFNDVPRRATVTVELALHGTQGEKRIPLRRIGRNHFRGIAREYKRVFGRRNQVYVDDVHKEIERIRAAVEYALEQRLSGTPEATGAEVSLNRAVNQLNDLAYPVRLAWDNLLWLLEEEPNKQLRRVRLDIERYGSITFSLSRLGRWALNRTLELRGLLEVAAQLWTTINQTVRKVFGDVYRILEPFLRILGLVQVSTLELLKALDQARLEYIFERGLPPEYLAHFEFAPLSDESLFLGFDEELATISLAVQRWEAGQPSSFIVYGHRGVGKMTLLNIAQKRLFTDDSVHRETIGQKIVSTETLVYYLTQRLDLPATDSVEDLAESLLEGPRRAVLLEGVHHLFLRTIDGLDATVRLFWLIARTNHHILWGICLEKCAYDFLSKALPLEELFHFQVGIQERTGEDLRRLIMARHNRSGIGLHYVQDKSIERAVRRQIKKLREERGPGANNIQEALEQVYFERLATVSAGNITVALFYWLRSLNTEEGDRYHVHPVDELNLGLIWDFTTEQAYMLTAILQHGTLTASQLAEILDADEVDVRLALEILTTQNLLQFDQKTQTVTINPVVLKTACEMLTSRNLLY